MRDFVWLMLAVAGFALIDGFVVPAIRKWWARRRTRLLGRLRGCYESEEEFAYALLAEGAERMEIAMVGEGTLLEKIEITPHEVEGFLIGVEDSMGVYVGEDEDDE